MLAAMRRVAIWALVAASACHRHASDVVCWGKFDPMFSHADELRGLELPGVTELDSSGIDVCGHTPRGLSCVGSSDAAVASSKQFVPFTLVDSVRTVTIGVTNGCAILGDGSGQCWGFNESGQLGNGARANPKTLAALSDPVAVRGVTDIAQLAVGTEHACARVVSGTVYCWGRAEEGQLGLSVSTERSEDPGPVLDLDDAVDLATMFEWSCAVRRTGKVVCWGKNKDGHIARTPEDVPGITGAIQVVVFETNGHQGGCVLRNDRSVACFDATRDPPHVVETGEVTQIVAGIAHMCALHRDGRVTCYGGDGAGQLGGAGDTNHYVPGLDHVVQLAAGASFTCARRAR
jgi:alpha-tubulin suppressor-like RCC1 family protein